MRQHLPEKARPLYQQALAIYKKAYGSTHTTVAHCLTGLAETYLVQEQFAEAEPLLREAIAIYDQGEGEVNPDQAQALKDLAWVHVFDQERLLEAEAFFLQALAIRVGKVGIHRIQPSAISIWAASMPS